MQPIISPIKPNETGPIAANLVEGLLLLIGRALIKAFDTPNRPTASELSKLEIVAKQELAQQVYGPASQQLVQFFQAQQGLGDQLKGTVDDRTAAALNSFLR